MLTRFEPGQIPITYGAAFNPQGNLLAFSGCATYENVCHEGKILFFDVQTYQLRGEPIDRQDGEVMAIKFTRTGGWLVASNRNGFVTVWDAETHQPFGLPLKESGEESAFNISGIAFNPDGNLLGVSSGKSLTLLDIPARQPVGFPIEVPVSRLKGVSFNADGTTLASVDHEGVKLWNLDPSFWAELTCVAAGRNFSQAE